MIRGDGWLVSVGTHHIESQFGLGQELGPPIDGKGGVGAGEYGNEVSFKRLNGAFGFVGALVERGSQLISDVRLGK